MVPRSSTAVIAGHSFIYPLQEARGLTRIRQRVVGVRYSLEGNGCPLPFTRIHSVRVCEQALALVCGFDRFLLKRVSRANAETEARAEASATRQSFEEQIDEERSGYGTR